jgi:adenosylcobinamide kinase/adenosylcobinamide-phosphate guanylyltransferase
MGEITFITGGARSGKSRFAESLAARSEGRVVYLATLQPLDEEMASRVHSHRAARPPSWVTVEEPLRLTEALSRQPAFAVCLLDSLTLWVSNLILESRPSSDAAAGPLSEEAGKAIAGNVLARARALLEWQSAQPSSLIVVTDEVGSGLVPEYPLGRLYRDVLGEANQLVAGAADSAYLCVAGHAIDIRAVGKPI